VESVMDENRSLIMKTSRSHVLRLACRT